MIFHDCGYESRWFRDIKQVGKTGSLLVYYNPYRISRKINIIQSYHKTIDFHDYRWLNLIDTRKSINI